MLAQHDVSVNAVKQRVSIPNCRAWPCPPGGMLLHGIQSVMPVKAHPHTITDTHVVHH